ncbi:TraR/DksA C4-type zinc finger protein [Cognatishimia sp. MH4019]|uniref:TraR/DksA C4-type zinc finger protein n=1 Tax=Cognatishimia sp. MH4019 TaxID=2854030 RepID=UPI001CD7C233
MNERDLERSEDRVTQERDRMANVARSAVRQVGNSDCVECGRQIPEARRQAAPFADRCIDCQQDKERKDRIYA